MDEKTVVAKNSAFLYLRFFLTMVVGLYTSRIILQNLGVENYGIYNVVAGYITIFGMLNLSLSSQRYISFELGQRNLDKMREVVRNFNFMNAVLCLLILALAETVGLWFLNEKMTIPQDRYLAALTAYQCTIVSFLSMIYSTTYVSAVISYEKMQVFAYITIAEVFFKLLIALSLPLFKDIDVLVVYSLLMLVFQLLTNSLYVIYCRVNINEIPLGMAANKAMLKKISGFAFWLNASGIFIWLSQQGLNILLNLFIGPVANAARGIATQVQGAIQSLSTNFMKAVAPQITKSYSSGQLQNTKKLFLLSSKYSFLLIFLACLPISINVKGVLRLWLGEHVPDVTPIFVVLTIVWICVSMLSQPCMYVVQASGKVMKYQVNDILFCALIFVLSYASLVSGNACWYIYVISIAAEVLMLVVRLYLASKVICFSAAEYVREVLLRILAVCLPSFLVVYMFDQTVYFNFMTLLECYLLLMLTMMTGMWFCGTTREEKKILSELINTIWKKRK